MEKSALTLAAELLNSDVARLQDLRIHQFLDDQEAHDDDMISKLYADFSAEFDRVEATLTKVYGKPMRTGNEDDEVIPLNSVFRFAIWSVGNRQLFAAASHEDRGVPILFMLGTTHNS